MVLEIDELNSQMASQTLWAQAQDYEFHLHCPLLECVNKRYMASAEESCQV